MAKRSPVMAAKSATPTRTRAHRGRRARASVKFRRIEQFDSTRNPPAWRSGALALFRQCQLVFWPRKFWLDPGGLNETLPAAKSVLQLRFELCSFLFF